MFNEAKRVFVFLELFEEEQTQSVSLRNLLPGKDFATSRIVQQSYPD